MIFLDISSKFILDGVYMVVCMVGGVCEIFFGVKRIDSC